MMRILHDDSKCASLGVCESIDPRNFVIQEDGSLEVTIGALPDEDVDLVAEAVAACPMAALALMTTSDASE